MPTTPYQNWPTHSMVFIAMTDVNKDMKKTERKKIIARKAINLVKCAVPNTSIFFFDITAYLFIFNIHGPNGWY